MDVSDAVALTDDVSDCVLEPVCVSDALTLLVRGPVPLCDEEGVPVPVLDEEAVTLAVSDNVPVPLAV